MVGTASVCGHFESIGGSGAGRGAPWDVGPLGGVGGAVGVEAGSEADPGGACPVCVAGAGAAVAGAGVDGIVADHGAGAAALDPE